MSQTRIDLTTMLKGGYLILNPLWGCAPNIDSKISLLVYQWHQMQNLIYMDQFFKNPKFEPNWLKFNKFLEKSGNFGQKLVQNWTDWYMNESLFLGKLVNIWVHFQFPAGTGPYQIKLEYPLGIEMTISPQC